MNIAISFAYLAAAVFFIIGIKLLGSPKSARAGNLVAAGGMLVAIIAAISQLHGPGGPSSAVPGVNAMLIAVALVMGLVLGAIGAYSVKMTAMPQMVALFNGLGGGAAALVAGLEYTHKAGDWIFASAMVFAGIIGAVSFSGSVVAWLKLDGKVEKPLTYPYHKVVNGATLVAIVLLGALLSFQFHLPVVFVVCCILALALGVMMVMPIGGADMPVVISLLNSFTGLAVAADGFAIANVAMIIAGTLVGSSGTLLTLFMCRAMNRSITNVLFGAFGGTTAVGSITAEVTGSVKPIQSDEVGLVLSVARHVVIVPGYGLAVAQAQHAVRELADELFRQGVEVSYAIHPVAGRMPGHMNVLLAEANVPYDQLVEMESINPQMERVDICLVIGANDVVNPAAHDDPSSPIHGMPIIEAEKAHTVVVLKRSMGKGFAGIENHLFFRDNCRMLFGDAKVSIQALTAVLKSVA